MLFRFNQWQQRVLWKYMLESPAWNMTLLYRVLSYLSRDVCGRPCHVKAKSRAIDKKAVQHISREKDVVYFNKQQCHTRDYVLNDLLNNWEI